MTKEGETVRENSLTRWQVATQLHNGPLVTANVASQCTHRFCTAPTRAYSKGWAGGQATQSASGPNLARPHKVPKFYSTTVWLSSR